MTRDGILLVGGAGFIGSALARELKRRNDLVIVADNPRAGEASDIATIEAALPQCGTVVHLASTTTPSSSARTPAGELPNLALTLRLLQLLESRSDVHLVFVSSGGTVYGNSARNPIAEEAALAPVSYYGAGKVAIEAFLQSFRAAGHPVTILRPSNAYGPGQPLRAGFGFIRTVLEHACNGSTVEIWGDGEIRRDFVYVDDVVKAIVSVIDARDDSGTFNVGGGASYSLNQIVAIAQEICSRSIAVEYHPPRTIDVHDVALDIARIRDSLHWKPETGLREGIERTWQWLRT